MTKATKLTAIVAIVLLFATIVLDWVVPAVLGTIILTTLFLFSKDFRRVF